jgi:hypothetical protein
MHIKSLFFLFSVWNYSQAFLAISKAYGIKTCKFPLLTLQKILLYPDLKQLESDLSTLSVELVTDQIGGKCAVFNKASVDISRV